jgi:hypothetical protein
LAFFLILLAASRYSLAIAFLSAIPLHQHLFLSDLETQKKESLPGVAPMTFGPARIEAPMETESFFLEIEVGAGVLDVEPLRSLPKSLAEPSGMKLADSFIFNVGAGQQCISGVMMLISKLKWRRKAKKLFRRLRR